MRDRLGDDVADEIGVEHDRIIADALSSTGGRLVKNLGDGALAVFDSSVDAVVAGQRIQEGVSLYNRQAPLEAAIRSADESERTFAGTDIASYLELALELWEDSDNPEEATGGIRVELVCRLASALADFSRQYDRVLDLVNAELATHVSDNDSRALQLRKLAIAYSQQGIATLSREAIQEALDLSRNTDRADIRLKVLRSYSGNLMMHDQSEEAIEVSREAIAIAADLDAEMQRYVPFSMLATALAQVGELEEALEYFDVSLDISQANGDLTGQLIVYANKGKMLWLNGRVADALDFTEDAIAKVGELGVPPWLGQLHGNASLMLFDLGRWDDAAHHLDVHQYNEVDHTHLHLAVCGMRIAAERGDQAAARAALLQASMHDLSEVYSEFQGKYWDSYVSDLRWQHQLQEAFDAATAGLDMLDSGNVWMHAIRLTAFGIEVAADGIEEGVADQSWLNTASEWHDRFSANHPTIAFAAQFRATADADYARAQGNNDPELWRKAVDAWVDHPYYRAKAQWRLAGALIEVDPTNPEALDLLDAAQRIAVELRAQPLLDAIAATRENIPR
jgi:tetratricopeptide (TPR) repeat protein